MRLLITLDFPPQKGGIQRYLENIVSHSYTKDDLVIVGCKNPARSTIVNQCPVQYRSTLFSKFNSKISLLRCLITVLHIRFFLKKQLSIECGNVYAALVPWLMSLFVKTPYALYTYGSELISLNSRTIKNRLLRIVLKKATTIITISQYSKTLTLSLHPCANIFINTPKIDQSFFSNTRTVQQNNSLQNCSILCVGRLVLHKGHAILLDALAMLPSSISWNLVLIGNGPQLPHIISQCKHLGIESKVHLKTNASDTDMNEEYGKATIFALPSCEQAGTEGFGIVLLEAMAHNIPIIATNVGGIPEVLDNGSCGLLVEPNNPKALADGLLQLIKNQTLQKQLCGKAHERLLKYYVW